MIVTGIILILLIAAGIIENALHQHRLRQIPIRILVNGTRGKTSVCRVIVSALNASGIRTMGRTTGSEACILLPDGTVQPFIRKRSARITELIQTVRFCSGKDVRCLVIECMALGAENQHIFSDKLVRPTHVVITNSYIDHVSEIGSTQEETVWTLSRCLYPGSEVFCVEDSYENFCQEGGCNFHKVLVRDYEGMDLETKIPVHSSNLSLAVAVCASVGILEEKVLEAAQVALPDIGLLKDITCSNGGLFIPNFAVNDLYCMNKAVLDASKNAGPDKKLCIIYNNRADREYRLLHMKKILSAQGKLVSHIYCIGNFGPKVSRFFARKCSVSASAETEASMYAIMQKADKDIVFLGLGNIHGSGENLVSLCLEVGGK